jgi:hypothetical protein
MTVPVDLAYPFTGRWRARNSPADRVPSHGTARFASAFAIDFVPVGDDGRSAPFTLRSLVRSEAPERFGGFGRPILAPVDGVVVATHDGEPDHPAHRGFPSIGYALTQARRAREGWRALAGNHVMIETDAGMVVALCHLRSHSVEAVPGGRVRAGTRVARCGNSGNSTEPHVHVQALDRRDVLRAEAVPVRFAGALPRGGDIVDV